MELHEDNYNYEFKLGDYISQGWELFKANAGLFIAFSVLYCLMVGVLCVIPFLGYIGLIAINAPLTAGFFIVAAKTQKQEPVEFGDFFKGFDRFLPLFLVSLVGGILVGIGTFFLLIPGIYLAIAWTFATPIALWLTDDFWKAMELSRKVVSKNWFTIFGFVLVLGLINLAGALVCGLGVLITTPLTACAIYAAYRDVFQQDQGSNWTDPDTLDAEYTN